MGLILAGCSSKENYILFNKTKVVTPDANQSVTKVRNVRYEYKIMPHDRISITMYNHPELGTSSVQSQKQDTRGILVNSRGFIRLPLVKSIHIAGLTQTAAQKKIEKAYTKYLEDAEVYLEVLNKRAYVLGEVKTPGIVPLLNENLSLLQLIASAGGMTDSANRKAVVILRNRRSKIITKTIDLTGMNSLRVANLMIYPNDVVYVTPNNMKAVNSDIKDYTPGFDLLGKILTPISNLKYLTD
jgi:polysaccharide export outer membrane protein